jgi:hypothetical protein
MKGLPWLIFLFGGGYLLATELGLTGSPALFTGSPVEIDTEEYRVSFSRRGRVDDWYVVSGGDRKRDRDHPAQVWLVATRLSDARSIERQYPDLRKCKSPGAKKLDKRTHLMAIVASDSPVRATLGRAVDRSKKLGFMRTCAHLTGTKLKLKSVRFRDSGDDAPVEFHVADGDFYFVDSAELATCNSVPE